MEPSQAIKKRNEGLSAHPWRAMLAVMLASIVSMALTNIVFGVIGLPVDTVMARFAKHLAWQSLALFVLVPFVLRLPQGKTTFRQYLDDTGLSKLQPFVKLLLLGLSCSLILMLAQAAASLIYRALEGLPLTLRFVTQTFDLSYLLLSNSPDLLIALPSALEELAFRGVALTVFLNRTSERKAILYSSIGFSLMHLLNLTNGRELEWVLGQLVWTFILGLFYGIVFVRTRSLLPSMIVHFVGNATVNILSGYMIAHASTGTEVLYQIVLSFGLVPTALMVLWTRFLTARWLPGDKKGRSFEAIGFSRA